MVRHLHALARALGNQAIEQGGQLLERHVLDVLDVDVREDPRHLIQHLEGVASLPDQPGRTQPHVPWGDAQSVQDGHQLGRRQRTEWVARAIIELAGIPRPGSLRNVDDGLEIGDTVAKLAAISAQFANPELIDER